MNKQLVLVLILVGLLAACSKEAPPPAPEAITPAANVAPTPVVEAAPVVEEVRISSLKLGKTVGADKKVTADTVGFAKNDTIFAGVETAGTGKALLKATWTYYHGDKVMVVNETEQTIESAGAAATEFHISKPDGWPAGDYKVEVKLNDTLSETKSFSVSE